MGDAMLLGERRLQDIGPFRGMRAVAREVEIPLTLIGGTASRVALRLARQRRARMNLFDLVPFSSDIDLEYAADPKCGPAIMAAIYKHLPFASWFRWSLIDQERAAKAAAQREISTIVPLRRIRFSTDKPAEISDEAYSDLHSGNVSFKRNPRFGSSDGEGLMPDAEIFGLMMALNVEVDVRAVYKKAPGLDEAAALAWLKDDGWSDLARIRDDERLRGRFWTLFATRWSLGGPGGEIFETLTRMADDVGVLEKLGFNPRDVDAPIALSRLSKQGQFRMPDLRPALVSGHDAESAFIAVVNDMSHALGRPRTIRTPDEAIDPALELVAIAPKITIDRLPVEKPDVPLDVFESGLDDEFIQLAWRHKGKPKKSGFTAQLLPFEQRRSGGSYSSVPAVGGVSGECAWIRIRLDDLTGPIDERTSNSAAIVILQAVHD